MRPQAGPARSLTQDSLLGLVGVDDWGADLRADRGSVDVVDETMVRSRPRRVPIALVTEKCPALVRRRLHGCSPVRIRDSQLGLPCPGDTTWLSPYEEVAICAYLPIA